MLVTALLGDIGEMRWLIYAISLGVGGLFFLIGKPEKNVGKSKINI